MSEYAIIFQALGALLALFFIFLTYMNTKTWQWLHVTMTFLVFAASVVFCVYAAMTLKTRATWVKEHDRLEEQVASLQEQLERVTRGDPNDIEHKNPSVVWTREALGRTIIDRGRVWRGCTVQQSAGNAVTLSTAPPAPAPDPNNPNPPPAAAATKNNIQPKTILYAFREGQLNQGENPLIVPVAYIGEFQAKTATDQSVTLEPTIPLTPEQFAAGRNAPWTLYEVCPIDGHDWFAGMDAAALQAMMPPQATGLAPPQYQKLIESYLRDGKEAQPSDPPENVWFEVKFVKPYKVPVDAPAVNSLDGQPFNTEGQAAFDRLRRAKPGQEPASVAFGPAENELQTGLFDQQTAQSLIDQGICELVKKIYRRNLTDYEQDFHAVNERIIEITTRQKQLDLDNKAMLAATEKANEQAKLVEELKGKATADLAKATYEHDELKKYTDALSGRLAAVQTELSQLYRSNKAIGRELAETTARLTEEIDRRTREATAMAP